MILIISFHFRSVYSKFNYFEGQFTRRLLKTELNDAFRSVNHLRKQIFHLRKQIPKPLCIWDYFFAKQKDTLFQFKK